MPSILPGSHPICQRGISCLFLELSIGIVLNVLSLRYFSSCALCSLLPHELLLLPKFSLCQVLSASALWRAGLHDTCFLGAALHIAHYLHITWNKPLFVREVPSLREGIAMTWARFISEVHVLKMRSPGPRLSGWNL